MGVERSPPPEAGAEGMPVLKGPSDKRQYQVIHLENGLAALLIHDPLIAADSSGHGASRMAGTETNSGKNEEDDDEDEDDDDDDDDDMDEREDEDEVEEGGGDRDDNDMVTDMRNCANCLEHGHGTEHHQSHSNSKKRSSEFDEEEAEAEQGEDENDADKEAPTRKLSGISPTKKAAAAMCVGVGSFSDPPDAQGLAHFLEHMLFMGSSKFPDENEYDVFLSKHGGGSNAFTDTEYTCYHFDINHNHLKPALDRFSQFFISPLAKADALDREVLAIDSEFEQVLQSDSCRLLQLQCHTANPKHPFHGFSWGNKRSLGEPMAKGLDMRGQMLALYQKYYLAGRMKLAVLGGESLDVLKSWVTELFGDVQRGNQDRLTFPWRGPVWAKGKLYRVESVKDQHLLCLTWPYPCLEGAYLKKPQDYISHLIGHEGAGSLLSLLKDRGWATGLSAGVGDSGYDHSTAGYMFSVNISLSLDGLERVLDVIGLFYQYVKLLRDLGPQEWVFQELQAMGMMEFRFAEEESADNYVVRLASNMHIYAENHAVYGDYAFEEWDAKLVTELMSILTPENMRLDVLSRPFDRNSPDVQFEPWFQVPYTVETLDDDVLKIWGNPPDVDPGIHMPHANEFIPRDFSIRVPSTDAPEVPRIIRDDPSVKAWYKLDQTYKTPRANAYFSLILGAASKSLKTIVLTELYAKILEDVLSEALYQANVAKLESSMSISGDKLELRLFGFNEKLPVLAHKIAELQKRFVPCGKRFEAMKEDLEKAYRNTNMKPIKHSAYLRLQILRERFWNVDDKLACLLTLSLEDLIEFIPQLFDETYMEAFCHGNLLVEEALSIVKIFTDALVHKSLPSSLRPKEMVYRLPMGIHAFDADVKNDNEDNSVVEMYFQVEQDEGPQSVRARAKLDIFEEMAYEPCFNQLRNKEQLGYLVDCGARVTHGMLGFCFRIQSSTYSPSFLQHRINLFIESLQEILNGMSDEEFTNYKKALVAEKMERDHSLIDETDRHWEQIREKRYLFEARKLEAIEVETIEKCDMMSWFTDYLMSGAPAKRKLNIRVWGSKAQKSEMDPKNELEEPFTPVTDISGFKRDLELYTST